MPDSPAARLISLNQQAIAIIRLGIPLELGLGGDPIESLREINERLATDADRTSPPDALLRRHSFPEQYNAIAQMMLVADDPAPIFESIAVDEIGRQTAAVPMRQAIAEPLMLASLAYVCMLFFCTFIVPTIEEQYIQDGLQPGLATQALIALRDTMPFWIIGFPIFTLLFVIAWRRLANRFLLKVAPGGRNYSRWLVAESQSEQLSAMAASKIDPDRSLELVREGTSPPTAPRPIAEDLVRGDTASANAATLNRVAGFYRFLVADRQRSLFEWTPKFVGLFMAAMIVFAYAMATFLPWIEVLSSLSAAETGQP